THTRLTHSLEVSSVGYSIGARLGRYLSQHGASVTADDVGATVAAACLAHDIGNPPFGHSGEAAIQTWAQKQPLETLHEAPACYPLRANASRAFDTAEVADLRQFEGNAQ